MTAEVVVVTDLTEGEAKSLTMKISLVATSIQDQQDKFATLVLEAYNRRAWSALGYASWDEYVEDKFAVEISRERSRQLNISLGTAGMSSRAVAAVTGTSNKTAYTDLTSAGVTERNTVLGVDGVEQTREKPPVRTQRRAPLTDAYRNALWDLRKSVERLERIIADDRFAANQKTIWTDNRHQMNDLTERLEEVNWRFMGVKDKSLSNDDDE